MLETLRRTGYGRDLLQFQQTFWGMVLIVLLDKTTRTGLLRDMLDGDYDLPERKVRLSILHETVVAVMPDCGSDEVEFLMLAGRLVAIEKARRDAGEAVLLARQLGLPFVDDGDWEIYIAIPLAGNPSAWLAPNLRLELRSHPDFAWWIYMHIDDNRFSERQSGILQNDGDFEGLGGGNLVLFPAWLRALRERHGLAFDPGAADIRAGRHRSTVKLIENWLRG